jgi:hypothetical protein
MYCKKWQVMSLAMGALMLSLSQVRADDVVRLSGKGSIQDAGANVSQLNLRPQDTQDDDVVPVWYRHRFGGFSGGGFNRGFYGGFYRGYPGFGGFYGGGFNRGFYPSFYRGYNFGYSSFYPGFNSGFGFGYPKFYYGGFYTISSSTIIHQGPPTTLQITPHKPVEPMNPNLGSPQLPAPLQRMPQIPNDGFKYDGGPANPVPLPQGSPDPKDMNPKLDVPDRAVSLPLKAPETPKKYSYSAYGEKPKTESAPPKNDYLIIIKGTKN